MNLHPTLVIPPIPEKHSVADYAAKPTKAKEDTTIIELRKRMLAVFLNRCRKMKEIREDGVWWRFLDPNVSWVSTPTIRGRLTLIETERGPTLAPRFFHPKEQPESSPARSGQSDSRPRIPPNSRLIR